MQKILTVFGTRPEAIKMMPILRQLERRSKDFSSVICVSGQHRQLLDQVLNLFKIIPHYDLNVMQEKQTLTHITASVMKELEPVLQKEKPDWVLVQGDTTTAMAASMTAFNCSIKIAHVEAGLRTWNKRQPFPEEINRKVVDMVSDLHFAPTQATKQNLLKEGFPGEKILVTGNTVIDALLDVAQIPYDASSGPLKGIPFKKTIILMTAHRRESFGEPLKNICKALIRLADRYGDKVQIVYPVHQNPQVWDTAHSFLSQNPAITLLPPLDYQSFVYLMKHSRFMLTDSGGLQEEAPSLGKPVLVLREVTERPEAVEAGAVKVIGTDTERIVQEASKLLEDENAYAQMSNRTNPYGNGTASIQIAEALHHYAEISPG